MRLHRLLTWLCTAVIAGVAAVYAVALLLMLLDGRMVEFSKVATGRSFTWADSPGMLIANTLAHATLLTVLALLAVKAWQGLPDVFASMGRSFFVMTGLQWTALSLLALTLIATFTAVKFGLPAGTLRRPTIVAIWLLWSGACALIPILGLMRGEIGTDTGRVVRRSSDPGSFWYRWITMAAWCTFALAAVTVVSWVNW